MEIDWRVVGTQIIGFLIVLAILRRFAWGPITQMLEDRRARIAGEYDQIEGQRREVEGLKAELHQKLQEIEAEARTRIQEAVKEGEALGAQLREKAREDAQGILTRAEEQILRDRDKAQVALRNDVVGMVVRATERVLVKQLDQAEQRRQIESFIADLGSMSAGSGGRTS